MELFVIGAGYVGLVTAACFAEMGFTVHCCDIDAEKIARLQQGHIPIHEPGLKELVQRNAAAQRLFFTTTYDSLRSATVCILALPTPSLPSGGCDTSALLHAADHIATALDSYKVIVIKSTVPVGTAQRLSQAIANKLELLGRPVSFDVVSNPEFLKEGCAVADCMKPDRVIIGCERTGAALELMQELYRPFMLNHDRMLVMDTASAELTKYAANAMLANRISFMNWMSQLCERTGADITHVRKGIGSDRRIGYDFLWAGAGYGGSCFPKDVLALKHMAQEQSLDPALIDAIDTINQQQKTLLTKKIAAYFDDHGGLSGKTIAILGLAFKPDTDDLREAPALVLIAQLLELGATVRVYDPVAMDNGKRLLANRVTWCTDAIDCAQGAHAIALVTEWKEFRLLDAQQLLGAMAGNAFFDGRNQYEPQAMAKKGFDYFSIGRSPAYAVLEREWDVVLQ